MRRSMMLALAVACSMIAARAGAAEKKANLPKMTCEEFLALGDDVKPLAVYWLDGYNKKGELKEADVGTISLDRPIAVVVDECKKTPSETLWQKIKSKF